MSRRVVLLIIFVVSILIGLGIFALETLMEAKIASGAVWPL